MQFDWSILIAYAPLFIKGLALTIEVTLIGIAGGCTLGLFLGMLRLAFADRGIWRIPLIIARWLSIVYITFFRGTPLFVQILLIHFAVIPYLIHPESGWLISGENARLIKLNYGALLSGGLALSLNSGAYISEIFRAGIQSIERGQTQAAYSLGLTYWPMMIYIILPQAFRRMLPPLGNELITLLKDSSLISAIGLAELAYAARAVASAYARYWEPYLAISMIYLTMTLLFSIGVNFLEHRHKASR